MFRHGDRIGPYILINKLGKGGFGEVWLAEKQSQFVTKRVAIKLPLEEQVNLEAISQEASLWEKASGHPNVLPIIDAEMYDGQVIIVSEYAEGGSLTGKLKTEGKLSPAEAVELTIGILDGLEFLHSKHIIHRDIKPQNILLQGKTPRLADFGISRAMNTSATSSAVVGTDAYMAPEAFDGKRNVQTDIWSVGVVLYQLLKGALPFPQEHPTERIFAILTKEIEPLSEEIPSDLRRIIEKALEKKVEQRYSSTAEMRKDLRNVLTYLQHPQFSRTEVFDKSDVKELAAEKISGIRRDEETDKAVNEKPTAPYPVTKPANPQSSVVTEIKQIPVTKPSYMKPETAPNVLPPQAQVYAGQPHGGKSKEGLIFASIGILAFLMIALFIGIYSLSRPDENTAPATKPATFASTDNPIKVGVFSDLTGPTSSFGQSTKNGIELAFEEINAAGGVGGRKLYLIFEDNQGMPEKSKTVVSKLINQDKVAAVIGDVASSNSLAAAPVAQEAKIPMITPSSTNAKVTQVGNYISRVCFIDPLQGTAMARFAATTLNAKTAVIFGDVNSDYSKGLAQAFEEEFTRQGGRIVGKESYAQMDPDFRGQLKRIGGLNPDVLYLSGYYSEAGIIAKQARELGMQMPLLGGDGWDSPELWKLGGAALKNSYITNHYSADDPAPEVQRFVKNYKAKFGTMPDSLAALAYDSAKVLADAINRAGGTENVKLRDAINSTKNFPGVTGKITLDASRNAVKPVLILKLDPSENSFLYNQTVLFTR